MRDSIGYWAGVAGRRGFYINRAGGVSLKEEFIATGIGTGVIAGTAPAAAALCGVNQVS